MGRVLASSEKDAYPILESLDVNYVLVIFGGRAAYSSDDINKLMWPIKIGSGVFGTEMPNENDFLTSSGLTVGEGARDALVNSVAYKLCYYRFSETTIPHSNFPKGYDTTRQTVVNSENIILETMEEAFTSENWIVRIYKVKNRLDISNYCYLYIVLIYLSLGRLGIRFRQEIIPKQSQKLKFRQIINLTKKNKILLIPGHL